MITDADAIEAALADAGWRGSAQALAAAWVEHQRAELHWKETWDAEDRCRHVLECPGGERFVLEWVTGDTWELAVFWPDGWGREHLSMRWREDLEEMAEQIVRAGGPFGGPRYPEVPAFPISCGPGRRLAGDVELRFELLREDLAAYFFIARDGALNHLWVVDLNPDHLPAALESLERTPRCPPSLWVQAAERRIAWRFTAWRPLLARAAIGTRELLLLCPDARTAVILAHTAGRLEAVVKLELRRLSDFDAGAWLADATLRPAPPPEVASPASARAAGPPVAPAAVQGLPSPATPARASEQTPSPSQADLGVTLELEVVASGSGPAEPGPNSGERASELGDTPPAPVEQAEPQFALAPTASPEEIQRHFVDVGAAIPPRLTGAATAVELWDAIREAHKRGALPIAGNWVDLVATLHRRGLLSHLPSDRASRAALQILAKLSRVVRRLHHRRWAIAVPG